MVDTPNPLGVHPASMSYVYNVFQYLDMLWIWTYGCALTLLCLCRMGVDFWKISLGQRQSLSDVVLGHD
jgi:hypothetical protein